MQIIKKINTSAAIALDSNGEEIVVFGKGIGFPKVPYDLEDLSKIERTFYNVDSKYYNIITSLPPEILMMSADIVEEAEVELDNKLNHNLTITLADHLNFAIERFRNGINLVSPISYDVSHLYPKEYAIGEKALEKLRAELQIDLPQQEATSITMHLINAESETGNLKELLKTNRIIQGITEIVEKYFDVKINLDSYDYNRFIMHLRYLITKLEKGEYQESTDNRLLLRTLAKDYPDSYLCAGKIVEYLNKTWGYSSNEDEKLYLVIHITRMINKER